MSKNATGKNATGKNATGKNDEEDNADFHSGQSGASETFPVQCSTLRKNGYVMIKARPCKIVDMSTSKTGKHGHAKVNMVALDIFTGKKYEDICPSTHMMQVPNVSRQDYQFIGVDDDGYITMMDDNGGTRSDIQKPSDKNLADDIDYKVEHGHDFMVTVISACKEEKIVGIKVMTP